MESPIEIIELLINEGSDINAKGEYNATSLHYAIAFKSPIEIIELLINKGSDINAKDLNEQTPLHLAISVQSPIEIIKLLLNKGSDINAKDKDNQTPLHIAIKMESPIEIIELLINEGSDINENLMNIYTPHYVAYIILLSLLTNYREYFKYNSTSIKKMVKISLRLAQQLIIFPEEKRKYERLESLSDANTGKNYFFLTYNNTKLFSQYIYIIHLNMSYKKNTLNEMISENDLNVRTKLKSGIRPFLFYSNPLSEYKDEIKKYCSYDKNVKLTYFVIKTLIDNSNSFGFDTCYLKNYKILKGFCFSRKNFLTENGNNILHYSCISPDCEKNRRLEESESEEEFEQLKIRINKNGWTPFYKSIFKNNFELSLNFISPKEFNNKDYFGNSARFYCKDQKKYAEYFE